MAIKALILRKKITDARKKLDELRAKDADFKTREAELEADIDAAQTDEERAAVEAAADAFDADVAAHEKAEGDLEQTIRDLENELEAAESAANTSAPNVEGKTDERTVKKTMEIRERFSAMTMEQRTAIVERDEVKEFLARTRELKAQNRAVSGADLLIPEVLLDLMRREVAHASRILPYVRLVRVSGKARQPIAGAIPEAVWTEMCASLNELDIKFNQVEVDGYKVGGYIAICNATLEDSDIDLAGEILTAIGGAIAKALDKAILFGTGTKMPLGITTRLAQSSQPESYPATAPAWTDLHTSNVKTLNIDSNSGAAFFQALILALGAAKPYYTSDGLFWVMNRKTHLNIMAKALAFDSNAALQANTRLMPVIGGDVVEFEDDEISDNQIIGGFGGNYLLAERAGVTLASSDIPLFLQDQTVFKGTARYDGQPVAGEAFVTVRFDNTAPSTSTTFPEDYANTDMNTLTITAAGGSAGKTVLTVSDTVAQSNPALLYKIGDYSQNVKVGDEVSGWTELTSGSTAITAATGKKITVVEIDDNDKVVSLGVVAAVAGT